VAHDVELILMKQVAGHLAMPVFLVDPEGTLLYFNEPAEDLLGRRYDETGEMPIEEWGTAWEPTARDGRPLRPDEQPLGIAVTHRRPAHGEMVIVGHDGIRREIAVTAFPLVGQNDRHLGAVALFWQDEAGS
jgi:PAS domain-containing protein